MIECRLRHDRSYDVPILSAILPVVSDPTSETEQSSASAQWNPDAHYPSGPGTDAGEAFTYGVVNWFVTKWQAWQGRRSGSTKG